MAALLFAFVLTPEPQRSLRKAAKDAEKNLVIFEKPIRGLSAAALAKFVFRAKRAIRIAGEVNVIVTSSRELRRLNRQFRGKDKPTDVLSFPAIDGSTNGLAGDVAISADIAADNARRLGHTAADEIKILALHGVLHLAGYDHEEDHGEMAAKEMRLRRALALPTGLIERNRGRISEQKLLTAKGAESPRRSQSKADGARRRTRLTRVSR